MAAVFCEAWAGNSRSKPDLSLICTPFRSARLFKRRKLGDAELRAPVRPKLDGNGFAEGDDLIARPMEKPFDGLRLELIYFAA